MSSPQVILVHSDRHPNDVCNDMATHFDFHPDRHITVAGDRPVDPKGTQRFISRSLIEMHGQGKRILIQNTDVPNNVTNMTVGERIVLTRNTWGYRNIPRELLFLNRMEVMETGTRDPAIQAVHYVITRQPDAAMTA